ncbi:hypothetical protein [Ferrovibrio sp.]|uniref:hypothetical protein n=1 Tax=Ferrovibrio sp. TaxID=1917215 RepID=UPI0035AFE1DD
MNNKTSAERLIVEPLTHRALMGPAALVTEVVNKGVDPGSAEQTVRVLLESGRINIGEGLQLKLAK